MGNILSSPAAKVQATASLTLVLSLYAVLRRRGITPTTAAASINRMVNLLLSAVETNQGVLDPPQVDAAAATQIAPAAPTREGAPRVPR